MNPLVKCPRCQRHGNPINASEFAYRHGASPRTVATPRPTTLFCEFGDCGWKIPTKVTT